MRILLALALVLVPLVAVAAPKPPAKQPKPAELETLFDALKNAQTDEDAQPLEVQILSVFQRSSSPSIEVLMTRVNSALQGGDSGTARKLLDAITVIEPNFAEGWYQRANLQQAAGDDQGALVGLQRTVLLNPRHFAALAELGEMLDDYGDKPGALKMLRRAYALDPHLAGVDHKIRELTRAVEGDRI